MKKRDFVILKTLVCRSVIVDLFINRKANGKELNLKRFVSSEESIRITLINSKSDNFN